MQKNQMKVATSNANAHFTVNLQESFRNKMLSSEIHKLRKMDSGQMMSSSKYGGSLKSHLSTSDVGCSSHQPHSRSNNSSNIYSVTSSQPLVNKNPANSEVVPNNKFPKEIFIEKSSQYLTGSPVIVQPSYLGVPHTKRHKSVKNVYLSIDKTHSRSNSCGSGYDSDFSDDSHFFQEPHTASNFSLHPSKYTPTTMASKMTQKPSLAKVFPTHQSNYKNSSDGYKNAFCSARADTSDYATFQSLEISPQPTAPIFESLQSKQHQLGETTKQLKLAKEVVKELEEAAQIKTWQALKEQEAILKEKEESLKYRERLAQNKYDEAIRLLDEFRKLSDCERMKDKQSLPMHMKAPVYEDSLSPNSLANNEEFHYFNSHDPNKDLSISQNPFSQTEITTLPLEDQNQSDTSIRMKHGHKFIQQTQTKPVLRGRGRRPKRNYFALNMCEVKPSIEPAKILRTYARKITKKDSLQPKLNLQSSSSPSYNNSQNAPICMQTNSLDISVHSKPLMEQVLVNESGTITITPLPKFAHQPKPYGKQKSSGFYPVETVSPSFKKCPLRIDTDSSPYSSSSDLSRSFADKVAKLTPSTNLQYNTHLAQIIKTGNNLVTKSEVTETVPSDPSIQSSIENTKFYVADKSLDLKIENTILKKAKKERLSMVTLESISLPSDSDNLPDSLDLPVSQRKVPDPLNGQNYEHSADIECTSATITKIGANYESGKYGRNSHLIHTDIRPEVLDSENNLSKNDSFNEIKSRNFSSPSCLIQNCTVKTLDSSCQSIANEIMQNIASVSKPVIANPSPTENHNLQQSSIKTYLDSSIENNLKHEMIFQEIPSSISQKCDQLMASHVTDQIYSFKRPTLSTGSIYMLSDPSKSSGTIPSESFSGSIQSIGMSPNKHMKSSQGYDKTHLTPDSFVNSSVQEIILPQAGNLIPLTNQDFTCHLDKPSDNNLQLSKVLKLQPNEQCVQPIPDKSIHCNEGVQINNIQNIIFDVKNINQTSFTLSPDKKSCINSSDVAILSPSINSLANNVSPLIQFDPKLIQCILNNTDQTIYNPPTIVYTSPTQNMVNSFVTSTVSSCPPPTIEENSETSIVSSTYFQPKTIQDFNLTIDEKHDMVCEKFESHISDSEINDLDIEYPKKPLNPCKLEKPKALNDSPTKANQNNLPHKINITSKDPLSYDDNIQELNSSSLSHLVNDVTFNQSKMVMNSTKEENVFPCIGNEDSVHSREDLVASPDTLIDADNESPNNLTETHNNSPNNTENHFNESSNNNTETHNNVCISSKGGRVLKLKEWWSDIVTESSKDSPKDDTGNDSTLQMVDLDKESKQQSPSIRKRKRGRYKLKQTKKQSSPTKIRTETSNRNSALFWNMLILPSMDKDCISFECGKCIDVYDSEEKFRNHAFKIHSGLVRLKGEIQEFETKLTNKILKIVFDEQKYLHCDGCEKEFKSIPGFHYHRKICGGIRRMLLICNQCGASFIKNSSHSCVDNDFESVGTRKKRKAAKACHDQMKMLYSKITAENDPKDLDFEYDSQFKQFFIPHIENLNPNSPQLIDFNKDLETQGEASCINQGCSMSFTCFSSLKKHLKNLCPANLYKCKKCCTLHPKAEINKHLEAKHNEKLSANENSSEEDLEVEKMLYVKYYEPIKKVTLEFRQKNYLNKLFPELTCQSSEWIEIKDFNSYLHNSRLQFSPLFKIENKTNRNLDGNLWERLDTFSGKKAGLGAILFAGGPIQSAAWCPIPSSEESVSQYIALASISNANEVYPVNKSVKHRGLLQIWECGNLTQAEEPTLALAIAHEYGIAWSFDWCPSGIYEIPSNLTQGSLNRLGYISAAFSDGSIRLFMIPHPHQMKNKSKFFEKSPEFSLLPFNYQDLELQCVKVCWSTSKGHSLIAGSFTNGMVCIWDLNNRSSILNWKTEDGNNIVYPINSIHAHYGVCSSVSFCPRTDGHHIVTGGSDRAIKFWDLTQPEHPVTIVKKGIVTDTVWLPHWAGAFIANDDACNPPKTSTIFRENGFYGGQYRPLLGANATVWGIACSEWVNALVQVDDAGEVIVSHYGRHSCELVNEKLISKRRYPTFTIHLQNLETKETLSLAEEYHFQNSELSEQYNSENNEKSCNFKSNFKSKEFKEQPVSLSEAVGIYGLKIYDHEYTDFKKLKEARHQNKQSSEFMELGPLNIYPLMGASSVAWNNNWNARFWIFVGLNSGLGRIIRLSFLDNQR